MRSQHARRRARVIGITLVLTAGSAAVSAVTPAAAVQVRPGSAGLAASVTINGNLNAVAATSAASAWAVGYRNNARGIPQTLIAAWNGTAWSQVPSPAPAVGSLLDGVAAVSARSAWAVGYRNFSSPQPLILHWNGTSWKQVPSPTLAVGGMLHSVAVTSARSAWAVGETLSPHVST